ncbi:TetR/AcrR family transcriptional regulator [Mycobacterium seoulense]|uniref:TetR/AcrR family transcriptional regulator n=2 Tax=Mycobacteriaceae TaxID=1762 RepID=UPI003CED50DB
MKHRLETCHSSQCCYPRSGGEGPSRSKPPALTEEQIVEAALQVIRDEGLEALSMRRLSRQLKRSAMAAYWYVSDKQELLDLVAGRLLSRVELPDPESGPWDVRIRAVIQDIDTQLHSYPGIAAILLERMRRTDRRLMNGIIEILLSAGFEGPDVFLSYAMIHTYLFGRYQVVGLGDDLNTADLEDTLAALVPHLAGLHGADFFNYGIDTIIEGLRVQLAARRPAALRRKTRASE